jgi:DNA-binding response OmpR family regulator
VGRGPRIKNGRRLVVTSDNSSQRRPRILVIDDDPGIIQILEANLNHANFQVISAANGTQALAKASEERPDLILLDVALPDVDGLEVCRRLKQSPETGHIPIIIVSAKVKSKDRIAGKAAGAEDYITKPFAPLDAVALVAARVGRGMSAWSPPPVLRRSATG